MSPFVDPEHRADPDPKIAGDRCFRHYARMMHAWRNEPRWTTFDKLASSIFPNSELRAEFLALLVLFEMHVKPYEYKKKAENGDI